MEFDPASGQLQCRYCGHKEALPVPQTVIEPHALTNALTDVQRPLSEQALQVNCGHCGAVVAFEPPEVAGACPFCATPIVAQPKAADPLIAPDAVLPAKVTRRSAQTSVRDWLSTRWFAPNALKALARQEGLGGVYLPFWTYDAQTASVYVGERGDYYYTTETYSETDGRGNTVQRTRQVRHTRWSHTSGRVARDFADLLIAATKSVSESKLNALEPWDLDALHAYEPAYLAGFKAQRYQLAVADGFDEAKQVMEQAIRNDVMGDIGGDEQRIDSLDTQYANVLFRHLLLPVWIGAYRFNDKTYQVLVNARTGEVQGERPYSAWKISLVAAIAILVVVLLLYLFGGR